MKGYFKVKTLEQVMKLLQDFSPVETETVAVDNSTGRVLAMEMSAHTDMPEFRRSTMDGYALLSKSTFGASEGSPAWLELAGTIPMGCVPDFKLAQGQAAKISTGGMLPNGADSVVMIEQTEMVGETSLEVYKSVAPLQHVIDRGEDFKKGRVVIQAGTRIRPQESGLAAALGYADLKTFKQPKVGILSTGDEIVPVDETPPPGKIRDINAYTLAGMVREAGAIPSLYGITADDEEMLFKICARALSETDMVLLSGGSSVGTRDFTVDVLSRLKDSEILVQGISISPGKPTILARSENKTVWGLPGHVASAMVVFKIVVLPFLERLMGMAPHQQQLTIPATITRNIASSQGRRDFVRVRLKESLQGLLAEPVLGKSGLIRTMVQADGLLEIGEHVEGIEKNTLVKIIPM